VPQGRQGAEGPLGPTPCPICARGAPLDVVAELATTWVTAGTEAPLPGYACVVAKRHVVEPFELADQERIAFWEEAIRVARVLHELFEPIKMNYEIHGNRIPHLHMHLFPRFRGDPYEGLPLDARDVSFTRSREALHRMRAALAEL
jgi:diadenosine tetraphosphate (Ap4A) HIT family hydrolase